MSGSSGFFWARAAARAKMISRRRLALDAWENVKFRLRGSTDASTDRVMARVAAMLEGKRVLDFERLGPQVLAGVLPRLRDTDPMALSPGGSPDGRTLPGRV